MKNDCRIIYREEYTNKDNNTTKVIKNNIHEFLLTEGIWALFGRKNRFYRCLNVGKCVNVGSELLTDISCLCNLDYKDLPSDNCKEYINQFGEDCGLKYKSGLTQEYLYSHIKQGNYDELVFMYVFNESDKEIERLIAWRTHAKYWRDSHPFYNARDDYYDKCLSEMGIDCNKVKETWKSIKVIYKYINDFCLK